VKWIGSPPTASSSALKVANLAEAKQLDPRPSALVRTLLVASVQYALAPAAGEIGSATKRKLPEGLSWHPLKVNL
jgi:hypothetical protein